MVISIIVILTINTIIVIRIQDQPKKRHKKAGSPDQETHPQTNSHTRTHRCVTLSRRPGLSHSYWLPDPFETSTREFRDVVCTRYSIDPQQLKVSLLLLLLLLLLS